MPDEEITDDTLEYNRSLIGVDFEIGNHEVTKEKIANFAKAIGETNPLYIDEEAAKAGPHGVIIAPPAYYTSIHLEEGPDPEVKFGNISFNASQHSDTTLILVLPILNNILIPSQTSPHSWDPCSCRCLAK